MPYPHGPWMLETSCTCIPHLPTVTCPQFPSCFHFPSCTRKALRMQPETSDLFNFLCAFPPSLPISSISQHGGPGFGPTAACVRCGQERRRHPHEARWCGVCQTGGARQRHRHRVRNGASCESGSGKSWLGSCPGMGEQGRTRVASPEGTASEPPQFVACFLLAAYTLCTTLLILRPRDGHRMMLLCPQSSLHKSPQIRPHGLPAL